MQAACYRPGADIGGRPTCALHRHAAGVCNARRGPCLTRSRVVCYSACRRGNRTTNSTNFADSGRAVRIILALLPASRYGRTECAEITLASRPNARTETRAARRSQRSQCVGRQCPGTLQVPSAAFTPKHGELPANCDRTMRAGFGAGPMRTSAQHTGVSVGSNGPRAPPPVGSLPRGDRAHSSVI